MIALFAFLGMMLAFGAYVAIIHWTLGREPTPKTLLGVASPPEQDDMEKQ